MNKGSLRKDMQFNTDLRQGEGISLIISFRMIGDTLIDYCHADQNQNNTPCQVPGAGRERSEPGRSATASMDGALREPRSKYSSHLLLLWPQPADFLPLEAPVRSAETGEDGRAFPPPSPSSQVSYSSIVPCPKPITFQGGKASLIYWMSTSR